MVGDPESLDMAKESSAETPISDADLTALALQDPPPEDFRGSEGKQESPLSEPSGVGIVWLVVLLAIGFLAVFLLYVPKSRSHEIARERSPDGTGDAVLLEVALDATGSHGYRVCMQRKRLTKHGLPS